MILADAGVAHEDGTFSLLRGGISTVWAAKGEPILFHGALMARVDMPEGVSGKQSIALLLLKDGKKIIPDQERSFEIPEHIKKQAVINIAFSMSITLPEEGAYEFQLEINGKRVAAYQLEAKKKT